VSTQDSSGEHYPAFEHDGPVEERIDTGLNLTRQFKTGATRDTDTGKLDFEGFLSPTVLRRFGVFMHSNRTMADGSTRDSDNWQRGIPLDAYMKSMLRHVFAVWLLHRGGTGTDEKGQPYDLETELCAIMFNSMGYLHETLQEQAQYKRLEDSGTSRE